MTVEGIDSVLLVESAQWSIFRAVGDHWAEADSVARIDNLLDRRLNLSRCALAARHQPVGQFI